MALSNGYTLTHEHMSIKLSPGDLGTESFELLCRDLEDAYRYGVRNIVDMTNQSMGRAPAYVRRLTEETGINIILSTGHYLEDFIDPAVLHQTPEAIAEEPIRDLTEEIDGSGMKAGIIGEIAWSYPGPREKELKSWEGMCLAARRTGATVSTHPSHGELQLPQAEYLLSHGVAPEKIVIGHIEFYMSDASLKKLLNMGIYIGLDMIGKKAGWGDEYRADTLRKVKKWGRLDRVLLSMDLCRREDLRSAGGYGYAYLFETFIPMLEKRGITGDDIELMLKKNPEKALAYNNTLP
jgi:phosphotriesterase-related protein